MALTLRKVDEIRKALDKYKSDHHKCGSDSKAILEMVNSYHGLVKELDIAHKKIGDLKGQLYVYEYNANQLKDALKPFLPKK